MSSVANALCFVSIVLHSALKGLQSLVKDPQVILTNAAFVVGIPLFRLLVLVLVFLFVIADFVLVGCIFICLAVFLDLPLRGRAAGFFRRLLDRVDDSIDDEQTRWEGSPLSRSSLLKSLFGGIMFLFHTPRLCLALILRQQYIVLDNLAEEHDPGFIQFLENSNMVIKHIGRSREYMIINCSILLSIGKDGLVEAFYEGSISQFPDFLRTWSWANFSLNIGVQEFGQLVDWRNNRRWQRAWVDRVLTSGFEFGWSLSDPFYDHTNRPLSRLPASHALNKLAVFGTVIPPRPSPPYCNVLQEKLEVLDKKAKGERLAEHRTQHNLLPLFHCAQKSTQSRYSRWMLLPSLCSGAVAFLCKLDK